MPRTTFTMDNVRQSATSFPTLKLVHGEKVRLVIIEEHPIFEWCHQLNKPRISSVTHKPVMIKKTKRNSDEEYEDFDYDFVGKPICLGDPDVLDEKGVDPAKCPMCKLALEDEAFRGPQRSFAVHVLKYKTKPDTFEVSNPFSVETLVWKLSDNRFSEVVQTITEWSSGEEVADHRRVDLLLGPCNNASFQNYKIQAGRQCEMLQSKERLERALLTYQESHAPDLTPYCGRVTERRWVDQMIEEVLDRWTLIKNGGPVQTLDVSDTLDSSLLDTVPTGSASSLAIDTKPAPRKPVVTPPKAEFVPTPADAPPGEGDPLNEFKPGGSTQGLKTESDGDAPTDDSSTQSTDTSSGKEIVDFDTLLAMLPGGTK